MFSSTFLSIAVVGGLVLVCAGTLTLPALWVVDRRRKQLW